MADAGVAAGSALSSKYAAVVGLGPVGDCPWWVSQCLLANACRSSFVHCRGFCFFFFFCCCCAWVELKKGWFLSGCLVRGGVVRAVTEAVAGKFIFLFVLRFRVFFFFLFLLFLFLFLVLSGGAGTCAPRASHCSRQPFRSLASATSSS